MPPFEGLIAEHPVPLAVAGVVDSEVSEEGVGGVLLLEAEGVEITGEFRVLVAFAHCKGGINNRGEEGG